MFKIYCNNKVLIVFSVMALNQFVYNSDCNYKVEDAHGEIVLQNY